jgi:hypothetical protein
LCAATTLECNGHESAPGFVAPASGDFSLQAASPNVARGGLLPGINEDYQGNAPDLGAVESPFDRAPSVRSILRTDQNPTSAASVKFTVKFSESVSGVDAGDFAPSTSGGLTGASVTEVSGAGAEYTGSIDTGSQDGSLGLNLRDDDSIVDSADNPLGGAGTGNGDFSAGEVYAVIKSAPINLVSATFMSNKANDGYVIESGENGNIGGGIDATAATFYLGDNAEDRQFRAILDFNTASLPDNAVIVRATLKVKLLSVTGASPFLTHQNLLVDIKGGTFGRSVLEVADFQFPASLDAVGVISSPAADNWLSSLLDEPALQFINTTGQTQFRLRFQLDDNDDLSADTLKVYSADAVTPASRPVLVVEYYVPQ